VHRKYGVETKEPTTSAAVPSTNSSIDTSRWIAMAAEKAWGIAMKRACVSRQGSGGAEGEVLAWRLKARRKLVKKRPASTWSRSALPRARYLTSRSLADTDDTSERGRCTIWYRAWLIDTYLPIVPCCRCVDTLLRSERLRRWSAKNNIYHFFSRQKAFKLFQLK
jgi:hypothetical protein